MSTQTYGSVPPRAGTMPTKKAPTKKAPAKKSKPAPKGMIHQPKKRK